MKDSKKEKTSSILAFNSLKSGYVHCALFIFLLQLVLIFGLNKCSALAPDETSYLQIFYDLYFKEWPGLSSTAGTSNWIFKLYFIPAYLLSKLGIEPIYAIRGSAMLYSQIIFAFAWKFLSTIPRTFKPPIFLIPLGLSLSFFTFASLGLKESFIYLNLILYFASLEMLKKKREILGGLLLLVTLFIFANLKFYIYILILTSTMLSLLILRNRVRLKIICAMIILSFFAIAFSPSSELILVRDVVNKGGLKVDFGDLKLFQFNFGNFLHSDMKSEGTTRAEFEKCLKNDSLGFFKPILLSALNWGKVAADQDGKVAADQDGKVAADQDGKVAADQDGKVAATNFYALNKPRELILIGHIPYNLINFMIGPIPGTSGGFSYLGLLDSLLWLVFFIFIGLSVLSKTRFRLILDDLAIFSITFLIVFAIFSAATEVNSGTSFRHRTVLFIPVLIIFSRFCVRNTLAKPFKSTKILGKEKQ